MCAHRGWIVRSKAGHDAGDLFCVVGTEGAMLLLADGTCRKAARPKRKQSGHVDTVCRGNFPHPVLQKLEAGEPVTDRELRRALAAFRDELGGNEAWQKAT